MRATHVHLACLALTLAGCGRQEPPADDRSDRVPYSADAPASAADVKLPVQYALVKTIKTGQAGALGIAIDAQDRLYVAGPNTVRMMDFDGKTLREWLMMPEPLRCIAVAQEGEVFVAEATKVHRFNAKFEHIGAWGDPGEGQGEFMTITDMVVSEPYVLVADAGHRCVHRFEFDGQFVNDLGRRDTKADYPGIICPSPHLGVAVDAQRRIYVTNPGMLRIEVFSRIGTLTGFWGQPSAQIYKPDGFFGCCNPTRVAVLPDGRIVTAEKIAARVKVHTPDGKLLALIGPEHFTAKTIHLDIAVDSQSRISALDSASGKVMIFGEASQ